QQVDLTPELKRTQLGESIERSGSRRFDPLRCKDGEAGAAICGRMHRSFPPISHRRYFAAFSTRRGLVSYCDVKLFRPCARTESFGFKNIPLQRFGLNTSMNAKPLCSSPCFINSTRCFGSPLKPRATKVAKHIGLCRRSSQRISGGSCWVEFPPTPGDN